MARNLLPFKVECKSSYPFFETMAAFNVECAANSYARECAAVNRSYDYRGNVLHTYAREG